MRKDLTISEILLALNLLLASITLKFYLPPLLISLQRTSRMDQQSPVWNSSHWCMKL